jgi:hypothetical protein
LNAQASGRTASAALFGQTANTSNLMATILRPGSPPKAVNNLGWLLRHWAQIAELGFAYSPDPLGPGDGELWAKLRDGTTYITDFACLTVAWRWLNRPTLRGLPFTLTCPAKDSYAPRKGTIGDVQWSRLQKLADHGGRWQWNQFHVALGLR